MKKRFPLYLILLLNWFVSAQTDSERKLIMQSYNMEEIEKLKASLSKESLLKEQRIINFVNRTGKSRVLKSANSYILTLQSKQKFVKFHYLQFLFYSVKDKTSFFIFFCDGIFLFGIGGMTLRF